MTARRIRCVLLADTHIVCLLACAQGCVSYCVRRSEYASPICWRCRGLLPSSDPTHQKPITYGQRRVRRLVSLILVAFMCAASVCDCALEDASTLLGIASAVRPLH